MDISKFEGEQALDLLADILEPVMLIFADPQLKTMAEGNEPKYKLVQYLIRNHKREIIEILAKLDGEEVENYKITVFTLPAKIMELLNNKELMSFFTT